MKNHLMNEDNSLLQPDLVQKLRKLPWYYELENKPMIWILIKKNFLLPRIRSKARSKYHRCFRVNLAFTDAVFSLLFGSVLHI
jgi:hypothetical protein